MKLTTASPVLPFALLSLAALPAQNLVRDLTPAAASSVSGSPGLGVVCNGLSFFTATDQ